jgi:predicted site-specific integrase-resolvase
MMKNSEIELENSGVVNSSENPLMGSYLTRKEVAQILRVSVRTVMERDKAGKIIRANTDGKVLYKPEDVQAYMNRSKYNNTPMEVKSNLNHLVECLESGNNYSLMSLKQALESQFETFEQGLKLAQYLQLGEDEENVWLEKIQLVIDSMNSLSDLTEQIKEIVEVDIKTDI